jgi:SAM-dependent methyltransferase
MGIGRRKVGIHEHERWVFNRMCDAYRARPAYPLALVEALLSAVAHMQPAPRIVDVGAGIGHLALPLAVRGAQVWAVEPAAQMLEVLRTASERLPIHCLHGAAEKLPLEDACVDLAVVADALHFLDAQLTGVELRRVLVPQGQVAFVVAELGATPYMRRVVGVMEEAAPRRPRPVQAAMAQVAGVVGVRLEAPHIFEDHTPLSAEQLVQVLGSISFIGPAMNPERAAAFRQRIVELDGPRVWSRRFALYLGRRSV